MVAGCTSCSGNALSKKERYFGVKQSCMKGKYVTGIIAVLVFIIIVVLLYIFISKSKHSVQTYYF